MAANGEDRSGLVIQNVRAGYGSSFELANISFRAHRGDVVGLIGPNGAGKSTLLKTIAGVLPLRAGRIDFEGRPLRQQSEHIAFVPQREDVKWDFPVSALDVVLMGRYRSVGWFRRPGAQDRARAEAALRRMGLDGMGHRHISAFSGGQQQRIFLARAIAQDPVVVLLDEPFTGIDAQNREILHQAIDEFAESGAVVLMATHDLEEVSRRCTHVACLNRRLVAFGPTKETFTAEVLRETFGGRVVVLRDR